VACDAHAHPFDLVRVFPGAEAERRRLGIACAASAWGGEECAAHEAMAAAARREGAAPVFVCFALHPQLPAGIPATGGGEGRTGLFREGLVLLEALAGEGRLAAVGETGFDLYDPVFRETEKSQDELFMAHLETARRYGLPLVLHVRRAMHKVFARTRELSALPAVIFHSWPGAPAEGFSLLRRGINAFFSFGTPLLLNHKNALRSCAVFPPDRLLLETDAPWQPLRGAPFSRWADLSAILSAAAALRKEAGTPGGEREELENITDKNFFRVFSPD
jgi:TatD DNase family protein